LGHVYTLINFTKRVDFELDLLTDTLKDWTPIISIGSLGHQVVSVTRWIHILLDVYD
jgi:hypothetical protein